MINIQHELPCIPTSWLTPKGRVRKCATLEQKTQACIYQFRQVHGFRYDYSAVVYRGSTALVKIVCYRHGAFTQQVCSHKKGAGCPSCVVRSQKHSLEDVLRDFSAIHGSTYDYTRVVYRGSSVPVTIVCSTHGEFSLTPHAHKYGRGCKECTGRAPQDILYLWEVIPGTYKVGVGTSTYKGSSTRPYQVGKAHGVSPNILCYHLCTNPLEGERIILREYASYRTTEFKFGPGITEMLDLTQEQVADIRAFILSM